MFHNIWPTPETDFLANFQLIHKLMDGKGRKSEQHQTKIERKQDYHIVVKFSCREAG